MSFGLPRVNLEVGAVSRSFQEMHQSEMFSPTMLKPEMQLQNLQNFGISLTKFCIKIPEYDTTLQTCETET